MHTQYTQVYQPWMDQPRPAMTQEQRKHMAELEKRAMEINEDCEKASRQLEMERKALEVRAVVFWAMFV